MADAHDWHGPYCRLCGGLGAAVEILRWGMVKRVCEAGHWWVARPDMQPAAASGEGA